MVSSSWSGILDRLQQVPFSSWQRREGAGEDSWAVSGNKRVILEVKGESSVVVFVSVAPLSLPLCLLNFKVLPTMGLALPKIKDLTLRSNGRECCNRLHT